MRHRILWRRAFCLSGAALMSRVTICGVVLPNSTFDRAAGSHALAAASQRARWADQCATIMTTQSVLIRRQHRP